MRHSSRTPLVRDSTFHALRRRRFAGRTVLATRRRRTIPGARARVPCTATPSRQSAQLPPLPSATASLPTPGGRCRWRWWRWMLGQKPTAAAKRRQRRWRTEKAGLQRQQRRPARPQTQRPSRPTHSAPSVDRPLRCADRRVCADVPCARPPGLCPTRPAVATTPAAPAAGGRGPAAGGGIQGTQPGAGAASIMPHRIASPCFGLVVSLLKRQACTARLLSSCS